MDHDLQELIDQAIRDLQTLKIENQLGNLDSHVVDVCKEAISFLRWTLEIISPEQIRSA